MPRLHGVVLHSLRHFAGKLLGRAPGRRHCLAHVGLQLLGLVLQRALDRDGANIRKADEPEDAPQVRFLKVEGLLRVA